MKQKHDIKMIAYAITIITIVFIFASWQKERFAYAPPTSLASEQEIQIALEKQNPLLAQYPHTLSITGTSGDFIKFSVMPKPGVEIDPAFGYAQKKNGTWTILSFGTGGDPTELYEKYNIPTELRDPGF